jgi:hypothetical protein
VFFVFFCAFLWRCLSFEATCLIKTQAMSKRKKA